MPDPDARSAAILADSMLARAAHRGLDVCAAAWANSATRGLLQVDGDRVRFWSVVTITAVVVVTAGRWFGL
jgi:hypothetical protein